MFKGLDHIAIVVQDADAVLKIWRDKLGFRELFREKVNQDTILLVHLDLGNTHLQLVQPLDPDHPFFKQLKNNGSFLHHICMRVDDVENAMEQISNVNIGMGESKPHQGTQGKTAIFLSTIDCDNVQVEITGN